MSLVDLINVLVLVTLPVLVAFIDLVVLRVSMAFVDLVVLRAFAVLEMFMFSWLSLI